MADDAAAPGGELSETAAEPESEATEVQPSEATDDGDR